MLFTSAAAVLYFCRASAATVERPEFVGFAIAAVEDESDKDFFAAASSTAAAAVALAVVFAVCAAVFAKVASVNSFCAASSASCMDLAIAATYATGSKTALRLVVETFVLAAQAIGLVRSVFVVPAVHIPDSISIDAHSQVTGTLAILVPLRVKYAPEPSNLNFSV